MGGASRGWLRGRARTRRAGASSNLRGAVIRGGRGTREKGSRRDRRAGDERSEEAGARDAAGIIQIRDRDADADADAGGRGWLGWCAVGRSDGFYFPWTFRSQQRGGSDWTTVCAPSSCAAAGASELGWTAAAEEGVGRCAGGGAVGAGGSREGGCREGGGRAIARSMGRLQAGARGEVSAARPRAASGLAWAWAASVVVDRRRRALALSD